MRGLGLSNIENIQVSKIEKEILQELDSIIGKTIPLMKSCEYDKLGFSVRDNHVFGLCLANQKLSIFPKCILRLEFIRELWFLEILLFLDPDHFKAWLWQGSEVSTRFRSHISSIIFLWR